MEYSILHGRVKEELDKSPCESVDASSLAECAEERLSKHGFSQIEHFFLDENIELARDPAEAKFLRVEAHLEGRRETHVFTFAILKSGGRYKLLWLQSAVVERDGDH